MDDTNYLVITLGSAPQGVSAELRVGIVVFPKTTSPVLKGPWKFAKAIAVTPLFAPIGGTISACVCAHY